MMSFVAYQITLQGPQTYFWQKIVPTIDCVEVAAFFLQIVSRRQVYPKSAKKVKKLFVIVIRCICDIFLIL